MFLNILRISALNVLQNATALICDHFLYIIVSIECIRRQQDSKNWAFWFMIGRSIVSSNKPAANVESVDETYCKTQDWSKR